MVFIHGAFIADIFRPLLPSRSCPSRPRAEVPRNRRPGWNTPSGRTRISGWPHSQAWLPTASCRVAIWRSASNIAPLMDPRQESQRAWS